MYKNHINGKYCNYSCDTHSRKVIQLLQLSMTLKCSLRIDKGSLGAVALLGTYIHHYTGYVRILWIL